jgi:membrane protease YdiL (CAAX protease family)
MPAIFILSLCLGAVYERTNNLWMPLGMHIAFNALSTTMFLARG